MHHKKSKDHIQQFRLFIHDHYQQIELDAMHFRTFHFDQYVGLIFIPDFCVRCGIAFITSLSLGNWTSKVTQLVDNAQVDNIMNSEQNQ